MDLHADSPPGAGGNVDARAGLSHQPRLQPRRRSAQGPGRAGRRHPGRGPLPDPARRHGLGQDRYIEKDSSINDEIDRLRHSATAALFARRDVVVVASVSCIYGLGSPEKYDAQMLVLRKGEMADRDEVLRKLVDNSYTRNDQALGRGSFRVKGD